MMTFKEWIQNAEFNDWIEYWVIFYYLYIFNRTAHTVNVTVLSLWIICTIICSRRNRAWCSQGLITCEHVYPLYGTREWNRTEKQMMYSTGQQLRATAEMHSLSSQDRIREPLHTSEAKTSKNMEAHAESWQSLKTYNSTVRKEIDNQLIWAAYFILWSNITFPLIFQAKLKITTL